MRASGAVQVLRSAQAARQSRRPGPRLGHVRLHSASCCAQLLWHAAAALARVAASDRPTLTPRPTLTTTKNSARRSDRNHSLLRPSAGCQRGGGRARPATAGCRRTTADRGPQAIGRGPRAPSAPSASFAARGRGPGAAGRALARILPSGEGTRSGPIFKTGSPSRGWEGLSIVRCPCGLSTLRGPHRWTQACTKER